MGQNSEEENPKPKSMPNKNGRQAASVKKITKLQPDTMMADKSSLFNEIVSLRDSASSRQNKVNNNGPRAALNMTPGAKTPYKVPPRATHTTV